jgi:hypothetical protein
MINDLAADLLAIGVMDVLGIIALIVMTLLLLVGLWIGYHIWKFKRAMKDLGNSFKGITEAFKKGIVPDSLGLEPAEDDAMAHDVALTSARAELEANGLRFGGTYRSSKMPSVLLATFADPDRGVTAAVANAGSFGITCDVVTMYEDGSAMTHRTLKSLGFDYPPQFHSVHVPDGKPADVLARHLAERDATKPFRRFEPDEVADAMEEFNSVVARWRTERGGLTEDEVRRNLDIVGTEADDDAVKFVVAASKIEADKRRDAEG